MNVGSIIEGAELGAGSVGLVDDALAGRVTDLVRWFADNVEMNVDQALATRRQIVKILAPRIQIEADIRRHPEILDEEIAEPVFIIGFPRSGTTLLQSLLGSDPAHQFTSLWQVREPSPPPGAGPVAPSRLERAKADIDRFIGRCPGNLALHPYWDEGAHCAAEDEEVLTLDFHTAYPTLLYDAPTLAVKTASEDPDGAYAFLKRFMQHQQWRMPKRRWIMKGTEHQHLLAALFRTFPDATCIWPHREPEEILPSIMAIAATVYVGISDGGVRRADIGRGMFDNIASRIEKLMTDPAASDPRVIHLPFKSLTGDPVAAMSRLYGKFNAKLSPEAETAMQAWLADPAHNGNRYGRHDYDFGSFGIDWEKEGGVFDAYRERFLEVTA